MPTDRPETSLPLGREPGAPVLTLPHQPSFCRAANDPLAWNVSSIFCLGAKPESAKAFWITLVTGPFSFTLYSVVQNIRG